MATINDPAVADTAARVHALWEYEQAHDRVYDAECAVRDAARTGLNRNAAAADLAAETLAEAHALYALEDTRRKR